MYVLHYSALWYIHAIMDGNVLITYFLIKKHVMSNQGENVKLKAAEKY